MNKVKSQWLPALWIIFSFIVWIIAFRGFLGSNFELTSDAVSYYDHTKFFIENLGSGIYPLWDPYWCHGAPNDFFLRRIGALNPFYWIILLLKSIGIPYTFSYLWFLAIYYWSGMIAFYLLAMRVYQDRLIAYAGYLLLLFSALGTRLFDSYMMLVTVPLIWFFFFLIAFTQTPKKNLFLGMVLFFMILLGTYIPLYFLITFSLFILLFSLIFIKQIPNILTCYVEFFKKNKIKVVLSIAVLIFSFLPTLSFFHDSAHGQIALPTRHGNASNNQTLVVPHQTLDWGAVEDLMYSYYFSNLRLYKFAVVYVPFFSIVVLLLGLMGRLNAKTSFIFLLGGVLFCCIVPHGLPFYDFLYQHLFFLKYFRNLHFFIWFSLIPLFVFLVLEHWKMFTVTLSTNPRYKWPLLVYVFVTHLLAFIFVYTRNDAIGSTYLMILLSLVFWSLLVLRHIKANAWGFFFLTLIIVIQPLEVYYYFSIKSRPNLAQHYAYDISFKSITLSSPDIINPANISPAKETLYYASGAYNLIYQNISNYALEKYLQNKLILVDRLNYVTQDNETEMLEHNFLSNDNSAIILDNEGKGIKLTGNDPNPPTTAQVLKYNSQGFKLLDFDVNHLRIRIKVPYEKFLIYNDSYDPYWHVSINNATAPLYEVNGAFKGTWIPAGENVIEFSYGCWWQYAMNILLSFFAFLILAGIIWYSRL